MLWIGLSLAACIGLVTADITGSNPATGACICADGSGINVRDSACGNVIGQINTGMCYKYSGSKQSCSLSGTTYEFFRLDFGSGGWAAGNFLVQGSASQCSSGGGTCPRIVTRAEWGARAPTSVSYISHPIPRVFIHHTEGSSCSTQSTCSSVVRGIQNYHMDSNGWSDIGYNFLVGEDGNAYEGRGWDRVGAHASNWNSVSLGISVMGSFTSSLPNAAALNVVNQLIDCGISLGKVSSGYSLHGHRDGVCTSCPGQAFYNLITTWPHYGGPLSGGCAEDEVMIDNFV